jgi:hypothetical protein
VNRAGDEHVLEQPGLDPGVGHGHRVQKPGALVANVHDRATIQAQLLLNETGHAGKRVVRVDRRRDNGLDLRLLDLRLRQRAGKRLFRHVGAGDALGGIATRLDPGASDDPLVGRVHQHRQVVVRHHLLRHVHADAGNFHAGHRNLLSGPFSCVRPRTVFFFSCFASASAGKFDSVGLYIYHRPEND